MPLACRTQIILQFLDSFAIYIQKRTECEEFVLRKKNEICKLYYEVHFYSQKCLTTLFTETQKNNFLLLTIHKSRDFHIRELHS